MKFKTELSIVALLVIVGFLYLAGNVFVENVTTSDVDVPVTQTLQVGTTTLSVEVVESISDRAKGLSGRESLERDSGMLFVFGESDFHGFWMKDMYFPIDIIWIDEDFEVVDVSRRVSPESFPDVFRPTRPSRYVLEVSAGFFDDRGLAIGDMIMFDRDQ